MNHQTLLRVLRALPIIRFAKHGDVVSFGEITTAFKTQLDIHDRRWL